MEISVKIYKRDNPSIKAVADITLEKSIVIKDFKVINGRKGLFVNNPCALVNGKYIDRAFPITKEFREQLNQAILNEYNKTTENQAALNSPSLTKDLTSDSEYVELTDDEVKNLPF